MVMSLLKKFAKNTFNRYSGNADFLEAVCAASALVAAADGTIDDSELEAAVEGMQNNSTLSAIYSGDEIESELLKQVKKAKTISGRNQLKRELEDVANREIQVRQDVYLVAADVANQDGNIKTEEKRVLNNIASLLRVNGEQLLAA